MPPPGGKNKEAEKNFANFMTSTAGGTQGSSSYGVNPPSSGGSDSGNQNNQSQEEIIQQAQENFQNQQQAQEEFEKKQEEEKKQSLIDQFDQFMTSFGKNKINIPFPSIATFGASALEGMNATNVLLNKLNKGLELDSSDKVAVVTLVNKLRENNKINPSFDIDIANILDNYVKENELSTKEASDLTSKFNKQFAEIEGKVDKEDSNISDYIDRMNNMSFGETVGTMYGDLTGQRDTSGITTLENITDNLGTEGLAYLKLTDPKTYYRLRPAQTSDQMRDLANVAMPTGNSPEDRRFAAQIMEAREMAARSKESQDRASGIMTASSAPPVPPPVIPPEMKEDPVPENPILNPIMSQRDPFNLAKFYASLPQYTQQGVMSPSLMQYYRNLGLFPRA